MTDHVQCIVAGAGVVGLAISRALAMQGREVMVLETGPAIGVGTSSRNSEVIHAGIYYPKQSMKAQSCVAGREKLYAYCEAKNIPHLKCGKLIVATQPSQVAELEAIVAKGQGNGVGDLTVISRADAMKLEPALACEGAILSPSTGIIDSHAYMLALQGDAEAQGALIVLNTEISNGQITDDKVKLSITGDDQFEITCDLFINAAGLNAPSLCRRIEGFPEDTIKTAYFAKGNYFTTSQSAPFKRLIYPVPETAGLGVHVTLDLEGGMRFGPDVEWVDAIDYKVDIGRATAFEDQILRYWPGLERGKLHPAYAGIRPKIVGPGEPSADFVISGPADHAGGPVINLFGIESPGLTASLDLADRVAEEAKNVL